MTVNQGSPGSIVQSPTAARTVPVKTLPNVSTFLMLLTVYLTPVFVARNTREPTVNWTISVYLSPVEMALHVRMNPLDSGI